MAALHLSYSNYFELDDIRQALDSLNRIILTNSVRDTTYPKRFIILIR